MTMRTRTVAIAGVLVVAGIATAAYLLVRPGDFTARGTVTITGGSGIVGVSSGGVFYGDHGSCRGVDGYSDLTPGSTVSIANSSGEIVALGAIEVGESKTGVTEPGCMLHFNVHEVPAGDGPYQVAVGHRNAVPASEDELRSGALLVID
ncbi:hypothetical protein [Prauserella endophytica]|uniref:Uncharacterized protein n=1 Tax=Prauserella endophytica TaxID=1592324 RepID=A0ABY2RZZ1_9PSEU|nr:hypothetical protein [Prauserella endophytica]PXY20327.1 hypothetical protein BAY59_31295 [Prauserella coralliicola]TKG66928.1 hypothetical protein FCN18_23740 [Prauserella endophytica]